MKKWLKLSIIALAWYSASSLNNVVGKHLLNIHPHPLTLTFIQLISIAILTIPLLNHTHPTAQSRNVIPPNIYYKFIVPLAIGKFLASVSSHVSILSVPVSYAHTVKATTPLFTVLLTKLLYKTTHSYQTYFTLMIIISGVLLASVTELNYNTIGLISALLSTLAFSLQNIFSKQVLKQTNLHQFELLSVLAKLSLCLFTPIYFLSDWSLFRLLSGEIYFLLLLDGVLSFLQHVLAFTFLSLVSPLTYSVANATKRIFIITLSILVFKNSVGIFNFVGIVMAIVGVFLYNIRDSCFNKKKKSLLPIVTNNNNEFI